MEPPCAVMSPMRAAGNFMISTVKLPSAITSGGPTQTHMSVTRAAGRPPTSTVTAHGRENRTANVRNRRDTGSDHRADVHVGNACLRLSHGLKPSSFSPLQRL